MNTKAFTLTAVLGLAATAALATPTTAVAGACEGTYRTESSSVEGVSEYLGGTGPVTNNNPNPSTTEYTVTSSKSVGGTKTFQGSVTADFAIAQAGVTVGQDWTYDVTTSTSRTVSMTLNQGQTGSINLERVPVTVYLTQYALLPNCDVGSQSGKAEVHGSIVKTIIS